MSSEIARRHGATFTSMTRFVKGQNVCCDGRQQEYKGRLGEHTEELSTPSIATELNRQ